MKLQDDDSTDETTHENVTFIDAKLNQNMEVPMLQPINSNSNNCLAANEGVIANSNPSNYIRQGINNISQFPLGVTITQPITLQDLPHVPPVYNGVNANYPELRFLHFSPPVFAVDNFLTPAECEFLINIASDSFSIAPVVGPGAGTVSMTRTSSTCYLAREDLPLLMQKVSFLTGKPMQHFELPQVGRYLPTQQYHQHYDAFDLTNEDGRRFALNGGQRIVTILIYLNDVLRGGEDSNFGLIKELHASPYRIRALRTNTFSFVKSDITAS